MDKKLPLSIAHGYGNSRERIKRAAQQPLDMIEADLWYRDRQIFLRHERRTPLLPILYDQRPDNCDDLGRYILPLGPLWYLRPDLSPLTLEEMLDAVDGRCQMLLDLKGDYGKESNCMFVDQTLTLVQKNGLQEKVRFTGSWPLLDQVRTVSPGFKVYYSLAYCKEYPSLLHLLERSTNIDGISIRSHLLSEERLSLFREYKLEVICWTVNSRAAASRLVDLGVDGIISDDLGLLCSIGTGTL